MLGILFSTLLTKMFVAKLQISGILFSNSALSLVSILSTFATNLF